MERYRVLLVDDEEEIRAGISRKIDWDSLGFTLAGEADNGEEALELAELVRPDVVLTDLKMPFMDGLELCRRLKRVLPAAKTVVFSGFDDFEYARQAVGMGVSEYIMKPINAQEMSGVLLRLKDQLDQQQAERRDMESLRRRYEESLPVLRELFYTRLLDGQVRAEQIGDRAARYEIQMPEGPWTVALFDVDSLEEAEQRDELLLLSVQGFLTKYASLDCVVRTVLYNDSVALLAQTDQTYTLLEELERLRALALNYLGLELTVGVGLSCATLGELRQSTEGARSALDYRVLMGGGRVLYIGDIEPGTSAELSLDEDDQRELANAVKLGTAEQVEELVCSLIERLRKHRMDLAQCSLFLLELTTALIRLARAGDVELEAVFGPGFTGVMPISQFRSLDELEHWCVDRCLNLRELLGRQRSDSAWRTVERAKHYIGQHYADSELSVESVCTHLHLSPAYFSTLFKREEGMSFIAYVTNVRMERAAQLLLESDDKTYLIAEKTGYTDPNYFSYVFKRRFGISPSKYRAGGER